MKVEATATSSSKPGGGAMAAPAVEAPVMETPITETPIAEAPVSETPACSDTPAPMETGRAGDGQSWAEHIEAGADKGFQRARPLKRPWFQSNPIQSNPSSLSPILQGDTAALLPPIKNYIPGVTFKGTRDVRVMD